MCPSALSLNSLHSFHPTAAESQFLCCASRKPTGSIALDSMLDPHHPTAGHGDANRFGSQSSMRSQTPRTRKRRHRALRPCPSSERLRPSRIGRVLVRRFDHVVEGLEKARYFGLSADWKLSSDSEKRGMSTRTSPSPTATSALESSGMCSPVGSGRRARSQRPASRPGPGSLSYVVKPSGMVSSSGGFPPAAYRQNPGPLEVCDTTH